jgi:exonuclease SbcD
VKILHTSDWHIGRGIAGFSLDKEQSDAVNFIVDEAISRKVDVFIIAGDIFDRPNPSSLYIRLFNSALTRLYDAGIITIATAGNHDGADSLAAHANLLKDKVHICGSISDSGNPIIISDAHGDIGFYPLTYLKPDESREIFTKQGHGEIDRSHQAIFENVMGRIRADINRRRSENPKSSRNVVVAHAFVTTYGTSSQREIVDGTVIENGVTVSESERPISVGGLQTVSADTFDGATYVAMGHLHGAQKISTVSSPSQLRYSGSLLRYSLSEINHKKSFVVLTLNDSDVIDDDQIEIVPIPQPRNMVRISATTSELLSDKYDRNVQDFVDLTITDERLDPVEVAQVRKKFEYIVATRNSRFSEDRLERFRADLGPSLVVTDFDIVATFFDKVAGATLDKAETKLVNQIIEAATNAQLDK